MKLIPLQAALCGAACALVFGGVSRAAPTPPPVVSQLHVLSIHVQDHATFDAVFLLCRDVLELPRVYGELSKPEDRSQRHYAGFSVGNAYLEPCGPYADDAPFRPEQPARFHGLTFRPATTLDAAVQALAEHAMPHSGVMAGGQMPRFVYLRDPRLTSQRLALSLWEIQNTNDHVNLRFLRASLEDSKGGALGVQRLEEVAIGFLDAASLDPWRNLLSPAKRDGEVWRVGEGPALRFVPSDDTQPLSIVFRVASLQRAAAALQRKHLAFAVHPDHLELRPADTFGLRIRLKE